MYYFNVFMTGNEAILPRILAEDTGAAELRTTMSDTKASFKFHRSNWLRRKKVSHPPPRPPSPRNM